MRFFRQEAGWSLTLFTPATTSFVWRCACEVRKQNCFVLYRVQRDEKKWTLFCVDRKEALFSSSCCYCRYWCALFVSLAPFAHFSPFSPNIPDRSTSVLCYSYCKNILDYSILCTSFPFLFQLSSEQTGSAFTVVCLLLLEVWTNQNLNSQNTWHQSRFSLQQLYPWPRPTLQDNFVAPFRFPSFFMSCMYACVRISGVCASRFFLLACVGPVRWNEVSSVPFCREPLKICLAPFACEFCSLCVSVTIVALGHCSFHSLLLCYNFCNLLPSSKAAPSPHPPFVSCSSTMKGKPNNELG